MKRRRKVICGAGLVVLDLLVTEASAAVTAYAGGTCGNVLSILAFLGWDAYPIARIGTDTVGEKLRSDLSRFGVRDDFLALDPGIQTPVIIQLNRRLPSGEFSHRFEWRQCPSCRAYLHSFRPPTKANADGLLERLEVQDAYFFDRVSPATVALAEASAERGALVVFEPAKIVLDKNFERALRTSHIIKYSAERVSSVPTIRGWKPWIEIQTMGRKGLRFRLKGDAWVHLNATSINGVRDTSGAGDWTTAGIIHDIVTKKIPVHAHDARIADALRFGQALAAINCAYEGARGAAYRLRVSEVLSRARSLMAGSSKMQRLEANVDLGVSQDQYGKVFCASCISA